MVRWSVGQAASAGDAQIGDPASGRLLCRKDQEERAMPYGDDAGDAVMLALGEDYPELRESIRKICEGYPGAYWRKLEDAQAYPTEFIEELTRGGFLASLIPDEYGGSRLPVRAPAGGPPGGKAPGLDRQPRP